MTQNSEQEVEIFYIEDTPENNDSFLEYFRKWCEIRKNSPHLYTYTHTHYIYNRD